MSDSWAEATFAGKAAAQTRRAAALSTEQRLAWLEAVLIDAARTGVLRALRERKQRELLEAWNA
jgi:hypothetical protein